MSSGFRPVGTQRLMIARHGRGLMMLKWVQAASRAIGEVQEQLGRVNKENERLVSGSTR